MQQDMMRYGVAAIEKMYPRQSQLSAKKVQGKQLQGGSPSMRGIKMKPKPSGIPDFEEVDARKILRPNSHDNYIKDPLYDSVVYIGM